MKNKIFLAIFLLMLTIGNAHALDNSKVLSENGVTIPLVADRITDNGEEGAILNAQVIVKNGTGHVFIDTSPYTQVDLQGSTRIAAMVASDVLGIDQKSYDFYYIIEVDSPIIGGPSAGGALTVATIAAINNWQIKPGVVMTGTIDPDEAIGPVGGIPFKLEAAATENTTLFLVPQGQLIVNITNVTMTRRGIADHSVNTVDLNELGKKLGITVKEVSTIQDAVLEFTGHDIRKQSTNKTVFTANYLNLLEPLALQLANESKNMYNNTAFIDNDLIKNALDLQNQADGLANNKKYYAATSLYFQSMVNILTSQWEYQYDHERDKDQYITNLINTVEKQIQNSENDLDKFKSNGISDVEVVGAAESRIMEASNILEDVKNLNNTKDVISRLAFANERARTAQWWLTLFVPSGKIIPEDVLKDRSGWYLSQAQSVSTYIQSLISGNGGPIIDKGDITLVQKEIKRGYYSGAIFDSLRIISSSSTVIKLLEVQDPSARINQSAKAAEIAINEARSEGIEPTLAVSIYEHGEILTNPFAKMSQYSYAKMVAKTTESLYSHALPSNETIKPDITIPIVNRSITPITDKKSPAFEAIILIIVILVIRRLKN